MKFGRIPLADAAGCYLAHATATPAGTLRKGARLDAAAIAALRAAGADPVAAVRLDPGDLHEDEAAFLIADALAGRGVVAEAPATGRSNLFADVAGLLEVDAALVGAINAVDPAITLATRPPDRGVERHRMVATVKIIPFAVAGSVVDRVRVLAAGRPGLWVRPYRPLRVAAIATLVDGFKPAVVDKTNRVLAARLAPAGASIVADLRVPHRDDALATALAGLDPDIDLAVIFGASALVDENDVLPAAIRRAGGRVIHLGMPVDPGNLLVLGELAGRPVVGAPGCARSPQENGFDWMLERLMAGRWPTAAEIAGLGVGGLLMDIVSRPAPRGGEAGQENPDRPRVAVVLLVAGRASRFSGGFKLTADCRGKPVVRHAAEAALAAGLDEVVVVTGHRAGEVEAALAGLPLRFVHNPDYADGQSTSMRAGLASLAPGVEAAILQLGDMPDVTADDLRALAAAYRPGSGALIVAPVHHGRQGNPVLWSRRFFPAMMEVTGDRGARDVLAANRDSLVTVERGPGVLFDVDTPEALAAAGR